ncbi:hypothetical protein CS8_090800 [Cupriavidus sp. 8B]
MNEKTTTVAKVAPRASRVSATRVRAASRAPIGYCNGGESGRADGAQSPARSPPLSRGDGRY